MSQARWEDGQQGPLRPARAEDGFTSCVCGSRWFVPDERREVGIVFRQGQGPVPSPFPRHRLAAVAFDARGSPAMATGAWKCAECGMPLLLEVTETVPDAGRPKPPEGS